MHTRSEVRHACFRAKNNSASENNKRILELVEPLLQVHQRWENFADVWDVIVGKNGKITIITPEKDADFVHTTLLKASLYKEMNRDFSALSDREVNIVEQVEQLMLENIMTWENYNKTWGVVLDTTTNVIKTSLYNAPKTQLEVTPEMIEASKKDADGSAFTGTDSVTVLEAKPMDEAQRKAFEEFLARKYKDKE